MKIFTFIGLFIISQLLVSCSSENDILCLFSKKKYFKKYKYKESKIEANIAFKEKSTAFITKTNDTDEIYASSNQNYTEIKLNNIISEDVNNRIKAINKVEIKNSLTLNQPIPIEILQLNSIFSVPDTIYIDSLPPQGRVRNSDAVFSVFAPIIVPCIAPISLIWGIIALNQIIKYPEKYSGKGFAIIGIILNSLIIIAGIVLLAIFTV